MTPIIQTTISIIAAAILSCNTHSKDNAESASKKDRKKSIYTSPLLIDTPRSFVKNYGKNDNNHLFVFVGEKIFVESLPHEQGSMDNGFRARYAILKKVYGSRQEDTIEFVAYDHYGTPPFSKFKNVLLYVSADSGTYYHQKYMYNDVYKTKDGRWAGTYALNDYEHEYNIHTRTRPVKIDFAQRIYYPTKTIDEEGRDLVFTYPKPYFRTVGDSAFVIYGNYIEELFTLKKDGVLTARGLFGNRKN